MINGVAPPVPLAVTPALAASSACTIARFPLPAASIKAVWPVGVIAFTFAPASNSTLATSQWLAEHASVSAVSLPSTSARLALTSAFVGQQRLNHLQVAM